MCDPSLPLLLLLLQAVELGQGPEARPPVAEEVVVQVGASGRRRAQRAQALGQRLGPLVAVDVQRVVRWPVVVVVGLVLLHLDHHGHVALAGGGRRRLVAAEGRLGHNGVQSSVLLLVVVVGPAQQRAVVAGRGQDGDVVAAEGEQDREGQGQSRLYQKQD